MKHRKSKTLLLALLNSLSDYDGEISEQAIALLNELKQRSERIPPLYADVFGLSTTATCADLARHVETLPKEQVAIASYGFQVFRSYEQMLRVDTTEMAPKQRAAHEAQMQRVRLLIDRTKSALAEAIERREA